MAMWRAAARSGEWAQDFQMLLVFIASLAAAVDYIHTNSGVNSSSRFLFYSAYKWTHRHTKSQTQLTTLPHASATACVGYTETQRQIILETLHHLFPVPIG